MNRKYKNILYTFDLIGITPQLKIFNRSTYKTILSSILSIGIILLSFSFFLYTLIIYFHFDNPVVIYSKDNDKSTNRTFLIKDTLLLLLLVEPTISSFKSINKSDAFFESIYVAVDLSGNYKMIPLTLDTCKLGTNVDIKYKEIIDEMGNNQFLSINESFCISQKYGDLPLYYHPEAGFSELHFYISINNKSKINPQKIQAIIVSENDIINHSNRSNPIIKNFVRQITPNFNLEEYTTINYDMQYVKYESDNGLFFRSLTILNAKSFSSMSYYRNIKAGDNYDSNNNLRLGEIIIEVNKSNFDNYSRTYTKLQTLITEIYAIINIFFSIGKIISQILFEKKMSKDIIRVLLSRENNNDEINHSRNQNLQKKKINKLFKNIENNKISSLELIKSNVKSEGKINGFENLEQHNKDNIKNKAKNRNSGNISTKILKKINLINIIKSFFCCKDKKSVLVNACHNFVIDSISIEKILKTLYKLENGYYILLEKSKYKLKKYIYVNKRLREINKYIYEINKELEMKTQNKNTK